MANSLPVAIASNQSVIPVVVASPLPAGTNSIGGVTLSASLPSGTNSIGSVVQGSAAATASAWPVKPTDGTNVITVKAASTAPVATDTAEVVAISPNTPAIGTKQPVNANGSLSSRQTVTSSESSVVAPANAVGVIVECESVNVDNLRWGFSSSSSAILSSTLGMLCEPGRDTGVLPFGAGTYVHLISTGAGSDYADIQWVLSQ
jgi:hypothetical protein